MNKWGIYLQYYPNTNEEIKGYKIEKFRMAMWKNLEHSCGQIKLNKKKIYFKVVILKLYLHKSIVCNKAHVGRDNIGLKNTSFEIDVCVLV